MCVGAWGRDGMNYYLRVQHKGEGFGERAQQGARGLVKGTTRKGELLS
jgi:hypothetical protein